MAATVSTVSNRAADGQQPANRCRGVPSGTCVAGIAIAGRGRTEKFRDRLIWTGPPQLRPPIQLWDNGHRSVGTDRRVLVEHRTASSGEKGLADIGECLTPAMTKFVARKQRRAGWTRVGCVEDGTSHKEHLKETKLTEKGHLSQPSRPVARLWDERTHAMFSCHRKTPKRRHVRLGQSDDLPTRTRPN